MGIVRMHLDYLGFRKFFNKKKRIICSSNSFLQCFCHLPGVEGQLQVIDILSPVQMVMTVHNGG